MQDPVAQPFRLSGREVARTATRFTSIHGPRWRMLIIGASEIAHYLAEIAATVDFQVYVCDPREEYRTAWRAHGARWIDGMPDDAVTAFKADPHSVILTVSHDPKLDDMALFYTWAGAVMLRDLSPRIGKPGFWLQDRHLDPVRAWRDTWKRRAGLRL